MKLQSRITWIDILESLSIFFVIIYHGRIYQVDIISYSNSISAYFLYFFETILSISVPLFFLINGYLLFKKNFCLKKHLTKIIRLLILTLIWAGLTFWFISTMNHENITFYDLITAIVNWKFGYINHLWFLGALICIYIVFPLLKVTYDYNKKVFIYFTLICVIMTIGNIFINHCKTILNVFIFNNDITEYGINYFNMFNPFRGVKGYTLAYFCLGGILNYSMNYIENFSLIKRNLVSIVGIIFNCFCLFLLGIIYSKASNQMWDIVWNGFGSVFTLFNVIFIVVLSLNYKNHFNIISKISINSLGIYLVHSIIIKLFSSILLNSGLSCNFLISIFFSLFILVVSLITSILIKKIPIIRFLLS